MSRSEEDGLVKVTREGKKLIIEVDRHTKMNGFTPSMFDGISAAYEELEKDDDLWVGVLAFAGPVSYTHLTLPTTVIV